MKMASNQARKQTSFKIQFYTGIEVTSFELQQFYPFGPSLPSPNALMPIAQVRFHSILNNILLAGWHFSRPAGGFLATGCKVNLAG